MKGLILAGGLATRLRPLTLVTNKHLLPIYNKPMIYYPLQAMAKAGIKQVLLSTGPDHAGQFTNLIGDGEEFGLKIYYTIQRNPKGGIAQGISLAEEFSEGDKLMVILGDNIFNYDLKNIAEEFEKIEKGAVVFGVKMPTESGQYGVIEIDEDGQVISIEEKPEKPKSNIAQTGIYMYDNKVFSRINNLNPSTRGELEVTDLNNLYVRDGAMSCKIIDWWIDAGTSHDELLRANIMAKEKVETGEL